MENRKSGCLSGIFKLFLLDKVFDWLQERFGYKSGSCMGCGCGFILMLLFIGIAVSIIFDTNWLRLF
jgi:hypothetical protein